MRSSMLLKPSFSALNPFLQDGCPRPVFPPSQSTGENRTDCHEAGRYCCWYVYTPFGCRYLLERSANPLWYVSAVKDACVFADFSCPSDWIAVLRSHADDAVGGKDIAGFLLVFRLDFFVLGWYS